MTSSLFSLLLLPRFLSAPSPKLPSPPPRSTLTDSSSSSTPSPSPSPPSPTTPRDHIYQVLQVLPDGSSSPQSVSRRQLLKSSGLRLRDLRSVDPSLFLINSSPSLLIRDRALLLNFGSLRAIAMPDRLLLFDRHRLSASAFLRSLLPRLSSPSPSPIPFELEVLETALLSRIHRLEHRLSSLQPRLNLLPNLLPNRLTASALEDLRVSKQTLVELSSRAGALKQMLLDLLEDPHEIRRMCLVGRGRGEVAEEEEEEEVEMLLDNYLQRCESCHGQAERMLDSAREMEDSIAVSLSSRRLEVSRVELLLQVGTFCVAVGALVAGIFGMNLRSYIEEHVFAFWMTTAGILVGAAAAFFAMYYYLRARRIL